MPLGAIFFEVPMTIPISSLSLPGSAVSDRCVGESYAASVASNRLRGVPLPSVRSDPVRLFEVLSTVGEIQVIDFSHIQTDSMVIVTYFDLRAARAALTTLSSEFFKTLEADTTYDSVSARTVRVTRDSSLSLDDTMNALSKYGEIERISFSGSDELMIEFFDTRGPIAVMAALSLAIPSIGGDARRAAYTNPPRSVHGGSVVTDGASVVQSEFDVVLDAIRCGKDTRTTLMIRNIPNKYSQKLLLRLIDQRFRDKYDFFYLPIDYKNKCNVGYAFINFNSGADYVDSITSFYSILNNKKWEKFNSEKICKISFARLQGQDALIDHFKSSSVMQQHKQLRPFFISGGVPSSLSSPPGLGFDTESFIGSETSNTSTMTPSASMISTNPNTVEGSLYLAKL
jgi:hypothetical protein